MPSLQENIEALRERITAPLLGVIPHQAQPDALAAATHLQLRLLDKQESHD
jgi:dethiobiotin synthetase